MKRRALLVAGGAWLGAAAVGAFAQTAKLRRIAFLHPGTQVGFRSLFETFRNALKDLGYVEGRNIAIDVRWAEGRSERLPSLAAEVVGLNPEVIVTAASVGVAACKKATSSIPIVFATVFNPVEQGFISSLQRPGGNITGIIVFSGLAAKIVEVAREAFPRMERLAMLVEDGDPASRIALETFQPSAWRFKFEPVIVRVARIEDLDRAFKEIADRKVDALYLPDIGFSNSYRNQLIERSLKARLPVLSGNHETTAAGGLLSYGTGREENYRRAAALVDKILRGANPAELPVEQPDRFTLVINRRTAQAIGANLAPVTMLRADRFVD